MLNDDFIPIAFINLVLVCYRNYSIPRLHDEDVSTIATHRPTKTVLQKNRIYKIKKKKVSKNTTTTTTASPNRHHPNQPTQPTQTDPTPPPNPNPPNPTQNKKKISISKSNYKIKT